ncbi:hypothetical protein C1645_805627 [Glomus cerebriforme]|uniref:TLDc domain-containing protein n=1 Tax=Glomus cerebriforme TaxID=658196 RepID=A0A397T6K4_9GLOM|nr:hypothetical protein C1645_805627 [Glomus cerebriforme]
MNNKFTINLPNITPDIFEIILKYIYTGKLCLSYTGTDSFKLLIASDFLLLEELVNYVQTCLIGKEYLVQQNFALVMNYIFYLPKYKKLQDYYLMSICENPLPVFTSNDFLSLDKDILFYLLKREDFQIRNIKEVVVWDSLIKWGINQIPELENKNNKDKWIDKNYEDLKNTLSDFIPLIKFININSDDFYDKVRPYKAIIPNNIYEEVMAFYLIEQPELYGHTHFESKIIKQILINIIINWIDKKDAMSIRTKDDSLYRFKLIYCGDRDRIGNNSFRNKCKGQVASLVLIKIQESDKIFGGYSSIGFNTFRIDTTYSSDNFTFSFEDSEDTQFRNIFRNINIIDQNDFGFNFGYSLYMKNQNLHTNTRTEPYIIEEIETYIVTKQ